MPVSQTNERALEEYIERSLVGTSRYEEGNPADFSREFTCNSKTQKEFFQLILSAEPNCDRR